MKYYSKSPEEWRKEDQKKYQNDRISRLRARAWKFFVLNLIIVVGAFAFIGFYLKLSGYPVSIFSSRSGIRGDIKVFITFNSNDGTFALGQPIDVFVYAQNTSKSEKILSIKDFSFQIKDESGKVLYSFFYSSKVEKKIGKFEKVLVFDLKREKVLDGLVEGKYIVTVNLSLNDSAVTVIKKFSVVNKLQVLLAGYQPFYFVGEIPSFDIEVLSENYKKVSIFVRDVKLEISDLEGNTVWSRISKINSTYDLFAGKRTFIAEVEPMLKFDKVGIYKQTAVLNYDNGQLTFSRAFQVIPKSLLNVENVKVIVETPIYLGVGDKADITVYVYNESKEDRFVLIKDGRIFLQGPEIYSLKNFKNMRIWLSGNEKMRIFSSYHNFESPGTYKVIVLLQTDNGDLYKEVTIRVGGAGE
ncbi:MAG: hypothetical protein J7L34_04020 [Thermotogaceae bacterium]|nr:hypothetical protein [Thermotogaceae bacterium]